MQSGCLRLIDEQAVRANAWMGVYSGKTNSAVYHSTLNTRLLACKVATRRLEDICARGAVDGDALE